MMCAFRAAADSSNQKKLGYLQENENLNNIMIFMVFLWKV